MPQISQLAESFPSQLFWALLTFGLVFLIVGLGMVPKVLNTVDARDRSVAEDLAAADAARNNADAAEERWRTEENAAREAARGKLGEARAAAARSTEATLHAANERLDAKVAQDEARIAAASSAALAEIETVAAEAAQDIVSRLSGASVTTAEAQNAVKAVLAHG